MMPRTSTPSGQAQAHGGASPDRQLCAVSKNRSVPDAMP
jgi:hypothetical protein